MRDSSPRPKKKYKEKKAFDEITGFCVVVVVISSVHWHHVCLIVIKCATSLICPQSLAMQILPNSTFIHKTNRENTLPQKMEITPDYDEGQWLK